MFWPVQNVFAYKCNILNQYKPICNWVQLIIKFHEMWLINIQYMLGTKCLTLAHV